MVINIKLFDGHNDCLTQVDNVNKVLCGVDSVILAIFLSENKWGIEKVEDICKDVKDNHFIAIEDVSVVSYNDLDRLSLLKPLYCSLTWNDSNALAGGCNSNRGITRLGKKYIKKIEEFSVVDTAHLNKKSFYKLARITSKPLFNSHTNLMSLKRNKRNIDDKQIRTIIKSNGLVCLTGVKEFLSDDSLGGYIDSIYEFYLKYGSDNLALSTDFMGSETFPLVYKSYDDFKVIYNELNRRGISEGDLNKIFYLNLKRFFNK